MTLAVARRLAARLFDSVLQYNGTEMLVKLTDTAGKHTFARPAAVSYLTHCNTEKANLTSKIAFSNRR